MRFPSFLLVPLFAVALVACSGDGGRHRSSAAYWQCQDDDYFGLSACSCGRCDRDGFDWSDRQRGHSDRDAPDRDPPPFGGKDT